MPATEVDTSMYAGTAGPPPVRDAGGLHVRFHLEPVKDEEATAKEGRPIYRDIEFCRIQVLGDKTNTPDRIASAADKARFPREYALFKAGVGAEQVKGTPLRVWPGVTPGQILELAYFEVKTVEQLADVSDGILAKMGSLRTLRDSARDWVAAATKQAPTTQLRAEIKERDKKIAGLEAKLAELSDLLSKATDPKTKAA